MAAYATSSGAVDLLAPSQQQQQRAAMQPALLPAGRGGSAGSSGSGSDAVVLVAQNGSLYGIPAAHLTFEASSGTGTAVVVAAGKQGEQCQIPIVDRLVRQQQLQDSSSPGSALALLHEQQQRLREGDEDRGSDTGSLCQPADSAYCAAATLGIYAVEQQGSSSLLLLLPPALNESTGATQKEQGSAGGGSWLMLVVATGFGASVSAVALVVMRRKAAGAAAAGQQRLAAVQSATANGTAGGAGVAAGDPGAGGKGRRKGSNGSSSSSSSSRKQQQQMSNRLKGIMHQAASEEAEAAQRVPPAAPAASQQQQQQQQAGRGDDSAPSTAALEAGYSNPAVRRREVKDGVTLVGRMQVCGGAAASRTLQQPSLLACLAGLPPGAPVCCQQTTACFLPPACALLACPSSSKVGPGVLGYGSGGTVVFSGELDGRPVAVKRMLRQFYEMARKEIDALILADEHPNIVRSVVLVVGVGGGWWVGWLVAGTGWRAGRTLPSTVSAAFSYLLACLAAHWVCSNFVKCRCFAMEEDREFVYLALERCKATLAEAMQVGPCHLA